MMMTLASDLRALWCALHDLRDSVLPLRLLVLEDRPEKIAPQPVQAFADSLDNVFGRLQEAIDSVSPALDDGTMSHRVEAVSTALAQCSRTMLEFGREWTDEVSSYHRLTQLTTAAFERGPAWRSWALSTVEGVQGCETTNFQLQQALLACWQSLCELAVARDKSPCTSAGAKER
jgi:hypothetical protein